MQSARYTAEEKSKFTDNSSDIEETSNTEYTATFTISADGKAEVEFFNKLTYYDKFSHADNVTNKFNGYKATEKPLFDAVKLCNFNETYDGMEKSILVEAFGIQSDNLEIDSLTPENVWEILKNKG